MPRQDPPARRLPQDPPARQGQACLDRLPDPLGRATRGELDPPDAAPPIQLQTLSRSPLPIDTGLQGAAIEPEQAGQISGGHPIGGCGLIRSSRRHHPVGRCALLLQSSHSGLQGSYAGLQRVISSRSSGAPCKAGLDPFEDQGGCGSALPFGLISQPLEQGGVCKLDCQLVTDARRQGWPRQGEGIMPASSRSGHHEARGGLACSSVLYHRGRSYSSCARRAAAFTAPRAAPWLPATRASLNTRSRRLRQRATICRRSSTSRSGHHEARGGLASSVLYHRGRSYSSCARRAAAFTAPRAAPWLPATRASLNTRSSLDNRRAVISSR